MRLVIRITRLRPEALFTLACLASAGLGALVASTATPLPLRADDRAAVGHAAPAGAKAPIEAVLHCPLAFAGVHLLKEFPERSVVAYHFCRPLSDDISQCLLYDGTGPDARLIGTEYLVSDAVYQKMPSEEKAYWHDHKYEVDAGLLRSLTQNGDEEKATLAKVRTLWGKIYHTWVSGQSYPRGPARLFWSVTGAEPFLMPADLKLPAELLKTDHGG
jgi:Protein of unknown function (DUF1264)